MAHDKPFIWSATEFDTGHKDTDGKTIYGKAVSVGTLPNNGNTSTAHSISNLYRVIPPFQVTAKKADGTQVIFDYDPDSASRLMGYPDATNVYVYGNADWSAYTGIAYMLYTRT